MAAAEAGDGAFVVQGPLRLPDGSLLNASPALAFLADSSALDALVMRLPQATLHYNELSYRVAHVPGQDPIYVRVDTDKHSSTLHDVVVRLGHGRHDGFLGFYPAPGAQLDLVASGTALVSSQNRTAAASAPYEHGDEGAASPIYLRDHRGTHVAVEAAGLLRYEGPGALKLVGPNVVVQSREMDRTFSTGPHQDFGQPLHDARVRWVTLEFESGTIEMDSPSPWLVAAPRLSAEWTGPVTFLAREGMWDSGDASYVTEGGTVTLDGALRATYSPQPGHVGFLRVGGRLDAPPTGLASVEVPGERAPRVAWEPLVGLAAVVALGAGGALLTRRSRARGGVASRGVALLAAPPPSPNVDECRRQAARCIDEDRWSDAALWLQRAHDMAPHDERLRADLAYALLQVGRPEEALHVLEEARDRLASGEAKLHGAHAALLAGRPHAEVEAWLTAALDAEPSLVASLGPFEALIGSEGIARAIAQARQRLQGNP